MPGDFGDNTDLSRYYNFGAVNPADPSVANGQISAGWYDNYMKDRRNAALKGTIGTLLGVSAAPYAIGAMGSMGGPAAASAAAGSAAPATAAGASGAVPAASSKFGLGALLNIAGLGVGAITNLFGTKKANETARYTADMNAKSVAEQMALERDRLAQEKEQFLQQQDDAKRAWDAQQAQYAQQYATSEDDRLYNRRLVDARESRNAGRRVIADKARAKLGALLGL